MSVYFSFRLSLRRSVPASDFFCSSRLFLLVSPRAISIAFIIAGSALYAYFRAQAPPLGSNLQQSQLQKHAEEGRGGAEGESVPMLEKEREKEEEEGDLGGYREDDDDEVARKG